MKGQGWSGLTLMNFTGVYRREHFYGDRAHDWLDCSGIPGTYGYCDPAAAARLRRRMHTAGRRGLHFLDNGNYHYLSYFWTETIRRPFNLVVFDHHVDARRPRFGPLLSCGSWLREALRDHPFLNRVFLIGAGRHQQELLADPAHLSEDAAARIACLNDGVALDSIIADGCPVYLSVDKDVLSPAVLTTNWDQGTMALKTLTAAIRRLTRALPVLGADICGEPPENAREKQIVQSDVVNRALMQTLMA